MVTSPTGKGVIVMGGVSTVNIDYGLCNIYHKTIYSIAMFELSESMEWTRLKQTLQIEYFAPLSIPIPEELVKIVKN